MSPVIRRAIEGEDEAMCAIHDQEESPIASRRERLLARRYSRRSRTTRHCAQRARRSPTSASTASRPQLGGRGPGVVIMEKLL